MYIFCTYYFFTALTVCYEKEKVASKYALYITCLKLEKPYVLTKNKIKKKKKPIRTVTDCAVVVANR